MADNVPLQVGSYRLGKTLGIGAFGKVKLAQHVITGHKVAIKILNRNKIKQLDMGEKVRREISILKMCTHPHIIRLYEVIDTPSDIFVVMEYVSGGELFDYIVSKGRLSADEARRFFHQIISGVEYCHFHHIVHRDLKPENLLLDADLNIKLADFGLSNIMKDGDFLRTSCGSPNYAAPEVISGNLYAGPEVDVWSCGVILYALMCGSLPFDDESIPNLFKKIKSGMYTLPSHLSQLARDLIPRMLVVDPMKRITIPEIRQHPWFQHKLPAYLRLPPEQMEKQERILDDDVVREVCAHAFRGVTFDRVVASVRRQNQRHDLRVAYEIILNHKQAKLRTQEVMLLMQQTQHEHTPPTFSPQGRTPNSGSGMHTPTHAVSLLQQHQLRVAEEASRALARAGGPAAPSGTTGGGGGLGAPPPPPPSSQLPPQAPGATAASSAQAAAAKRRRWYLGIQSKKDPAHVMTEVYKALIQLGCEWTAVSSYRVKCRWRPNMHVMPHFEHMGVIQRRPSYQSQHSRFFMSPQHSSSAMEVGDEGGLGDPRGSGSSIDFWPVDPQAAADDASQNPLLQPEYAIIIGLNLYKVQQGIYLLDFQRMEGDCFSFMNFSARIITELKTLSAASRQQQLAAQQAAMMMQEQQLQQQHVQGPGPQLATIPPHRGGTIPPGHGV